MDHGDDDGTPKCLEFLVVHREIAAHVAEHLIPTVFRIREVLAELRNRESLVQLLNRSIGLID
jgi:hypothetical protein